MLAYFRLKDTGEHTACTTVESAFVLSKLINRAADIERQFNLKFRNGDFDLAFHKAARLFRTFCEAPEGVSEFDPTLFSYPCQLDPSYNILQRKL